MSDVNWKPKGAKVMRRDPPEKEEKEAKSGKKKLALKKLKPADDAPVTKAKVKRGVVEMPSGDAPVTKAKVKRGVVEMPSGPDLGKRVLKNIKDKTKKDTSAKKEKPDTQKVKNGKSGKAQEDMIVLWENDDGTSRVVATVSPASDKYPPMLNVRRQYRRKDETEWAFTRDGFSIPNPNRKMAQHIADGISKLAGMIK